MFEEINQGDIEGVRLAINSGSDVNAKDDFGSGMCNITRCCTDVCPEHIQITDNGIIPLKERVVDRFYDPIIWLWRKLFKNQA